jgi:hypothetical protein
MNRAEAAKLWPLIKAWSEGKTLQCRNKGGWESDDSFVFVFGAESYRIKPEPREWWIIQNNGTSFFTRMFSSKKDADDHIKQCWHPEALTAFKVREVLDEDNKSE